MFKIKNDKEFQEIFYEYIISDKGYRVSKDDKYDQEIVNFFDNNNSQKASKILEGYSTNKYKLIGEIEKKINEFIKGYKQI